MIAPFFHRLRLLAAVLAVAAVTLPHPASAHTVKLFALAQGESIHGYGYFPGGGRPKGAAITVFDQNGRPLARLTTDQDGAFRFRPTSRQDYRFVLNTGDGHQASFTVRASELPPSLPPAAGGEKLPPPASPTSSPSAPEPAAAPGRLEKLVARAVAREITPLREQLDQYQNTIRFHDVIGGLGYILGLFGLAAWLLARKR